MTPLGLDSVKANGPNGYAETFSWKQRNAGTMDVVFDWRLMSNNGLTMCSSHQGYTERNDAAEGFVRCQELMEFRTLEIREAP